MKKLFLSAWILAGLVFSSKMAHASEGMWLPSQADKYFDKMVAKGFKLSPTDIYDINKSSLKDAVVQFANYCTGEIVSSKGLLFTNHHCGYESIAELSTAGSGNYLDKGYWAQNLEQEIPVPGLTISRLVSVTDITSRITSASDIKAEIKKVKAELEASTGLKIDIKSMFYGSEYYAMAYEVFRDIRMVGAPPSSIGNYGGDTDNWMWPRHTGDFSVFRIYAGADNKPADYSTENQPYKPAKHLKINIGGIKENDFAMIMGFPGSTTRYLTTADVNAIAKDDYPDKIKILDEILAIMETAMDKDENVRINLASNFASTANSAKYFKGLVNALRSSACLDSKSTLQKEFKTWANADQARKSTYGDVVDKIETIVAASAGVQKLENYLFYGYYKVGFMQFAFGFLGLDGQLEPKGTDVQKVVAPLKEDLEAYFEKRDLASEQTILAAALRMGYNNLPEEHRISTYKNKFFSKVKPSADQDQFDAYAAYVYSKSIFTSKARMEAFFNKPSKKALDADPGYQYLLEFYALYQAYAGESQMKTAGIDELYKTYVKGLREFKNDQYFYSDANFSMRLTFGNVKPYVPKDGVFYNWYTTQQGILEKYTPGDKEFDIDQNLKSLLEKKDFGRYGANGALNICFIADLDITGGNSGSPVMDANGNLIGIAFDGVWEGMVGDLYFDESRNRTISVDIRYVLFVIEKHGGAKHLIDEMDIVM